MGGAVVLLSVPLLALAGSVATAPAASAANPTFPFDWSIKVSTHLKKLDQTVKVPRGSFTGQVDLVTGDLIGHIKLPPASSTVQMAGLGLVTATFQMNAVKPVTGHVDFATLHTTATSVINIRVLRVSPAGVPAVNLVGDSCRTSKPVTVRISGTASLTAPSTFRGSYTIPPLEHCGASTLVLNQLVPGPGNTFTATATPK